MSNNNPTTTSTPVELKLDLFDWNPDDQILTAEMSTLSGGGFRGLYRLSGGGVGLVIVSHVTGKRYEFKYHETILVGHGEDQEFGGYRLRPVDPACPIVVLCIFND